MLSNPNNIFPAQKLPFTKKNEEWRKKCVNGAEQISIYRSQGLRKSYYNKRINYNLYSDILDQADIERTCNPLGVLGMNAPAKMQNYPIANPKIDLMVGESIERRLDWKVRIMNDDAISEKEEELKKKFAQMMVDHIKKGSDEKEMQEDLRKFQQFSNYEFQDMRERMATHILTYLYSHLKLDYLFSKGFKDALLAAEEIYQCDIVGGEPVVTKLNPLNVNCVRSGESPYIEDSDIITISIYMSPGQIIDEYHEELTPSEIDYIESGMVGNVGATSSLGIDIGRKPELALKVDESIDLATLASNTGFASPYDNNGNIKVTKAYWKSMRKVKKVKFYDEDGVIQTDIFDENYIINTKAGETEEILWISEWWEGHKIGGMNGQENDSNALYKKMRPRPIQFRSMENPSKCHPGIVGTIYNTNDNEGVSLMDRMKPYQYMYNVLAYNTELAIAKNKGKIMRMDLASIPENWKIDQWLSFASGMNVAFYDSFKEGNKGAAQGKLAGTMNQNSPVIDMEMGNTIQLYMNMMAFIKQEMSEIAGISPSRQGAIQNRQTNGNTQVEVTQSSMITEYWFLEHEQVKLRVLSALLETAKYAWKDKRNRKVQHVLDDGSTLMFEIDTKQFNESEYGLQITNGRGSAELLNAMKQLAHAGIQNGLMNFSQLLDIYSTDSMASIRRKIVKAEEDKSQRDQEEARRKEVMQREALKAQADMAEAQRDFTREEWDREDARLESTNLNKLEVERMRQDNNESRSADTPTISLDGLKSEADKIAKDHHAKMMAIKETERHNKETEDIAREDIKVKKIAANKKPSSSGK